MSESWNIAQAAEFLKIHPDTLAARARAGKIPGARVGRAWVFLPEQLRALKPRREPKRIPWRQLVAASQRIANGGPSPDDGIRARVRRIRQQTPPWCDKTHLRVMYRMAARVRECTGLKFHLDHVLPLKGKLVSGLHVGANLALLHANQNQRKHARFDPQ